MAQALDTGMARSVIGHITYGWRFLTLFHPPCVGAIAGGREPTNATTGLIL
jgi:hypothetical protein